MLEANDVMSGGLADQDRRDRTFLRLALPLAIIGSLLFLIAPRTLPGLVAALGLGALLWSDPGQLIARMRPDRWLIPPALLLIYLVVNATWTTDPPRAITGLGLFAALLLVVWLSARGLARMPEAHRARLARGVAAAALVGTAYLLIEELTDQGLKQTLYNLLPALRPDEKHLVMDGDTIKRVQPYVTNRNMAALVMSVWAVLLVLRSQKLVAGRSATVAIAGLALAVIVTVASSTHETSGIALASGGAVLALAHVSRRAALIALSIAWAAATLLVVPAVSTAYQNGLHFASWLPDTARHRIIIWGYTAEQIPNQPLLGVGLGSTKILDARREAEYRTPPGYNYPRRTGTHSHNIYLQIWYELGGLGALLACACGLTLLAGITRLPDASRPYAFATFAACASYAGFAWGLWQPWYMASFAVAAMLMLICAGATGAANALAPGQAPARS